jgi:hypothetical protein
MGQLAAPFAPCQRFSPAIGQSCGILAAGAQSVVTFSILVGYPVVVFGQIMNSTKPPVADSFPGAGRAEFGQAASSALSMRWAALNDAAALVCKLAMIVPEARTPELRNFPAIMRDVGGWRQLLAEQGIDDLAAMMEPGLAALLAVHARGQSPAPAALVLWREFHAARAALLDLVPPLGIRRRA